jgi:diguanylate cyclase (GGDEF)-like protein
MMAANAYNALVLVVAVWSSPQRQLAIAWAATILMTVIYHTYRNYCASRPKSSVPSARAIKRAVRNALVLGGLWSALPLMFFANASVGGQTIIACLCAGMMGGGAFAFASIPAAAIAFTGPIAVSSAIAIGRHGDTAYIMLALLLVSYIIVLMKGIFVYAAQITNRVTAQVQAESRARRDELTELPNRLAFFESLECAFARLARMCEHFAVLYLDLNDFKGINDKFGHSVGDKLLVQVGGRLKACVREIDSVARLGGDEFALIVANSTSVDVAVSLADRIIRSFDAPFKIEGIEVSASACIGIAIAPTDGKDSESLLKHADEALYTAKRGQGGAIRLYDTEHKEHMRQRRKLERDLRRAIGRDEFFLVFQPIVQLDTRRVTGAEALIRWQHPTIGVRSPSEFMRITEEIGLIEEIGSWVIRNACMAAALWPKETRVAVNVSPVQLRQVNILSCIVDALRESKILPRRLELEITETAIIADNDCIVSNLKALRELGVRIALDDFGTGYSSLTYLRKLSPDSIKIDGSFVRDLLVDADCASIVKSMISLSKDLNINVVAEGIESAEQLAFVGSQRCDEVQGNLISTPKSVNEFSAYLWGNSNAKIGVA